MSKFQAKVTEVSIYMDELFITSISAPNENLDATPDEAQLRDFEMSLFSLEEWVEISELIAKAITAVTEQNQ